MRLNNRITDHGFVFPDLAEFVDVRDEWRSPLTHHPGALFDAFKAGDGGRFAALVQALIEPERLGSQHWHKLLMGHYHFYQRHVRYTYPHGNDAWFIYQHGFWQTEFKDLASHVSVQLQPTIDQLKAMAVPQPPKLGMYDRSTLIPPAILPDFVHRRLTEVAGAYYATDFEIDHIRLIVSQHNDYLPRMFYYDCETTPRTLAMHIDPKEDVMKAIIYLEDVGEGDGPFCFVPESHRWVLDPIQNLFGRAISTGNYCATPALRESVFRLPASLRVSHNFGRAVADGSELSERLLSGEVRFHGPAGTTIVFDPGRGIHRGGICDPGGQRVALQVVMKPC